MRVAQKDKGRVTPGGPHLEGQGMRPRGTRDGPVTSEGLGQGRTLGSPPGVPRPPSKIVDRTVGQEGGASQGALGVTYTSCIKDLHGEGTPRHYPLNEERPRGQHPRQAGALRAAGDAPRGELLRFVSEKPRVGGKNPTADRCTTF